jgi:SM-20-related protein
MNGKPTEHSVVMIEEFLAPSELNWLWHFTMSRAADFVPSHVVGADDRGIVDPAFRRSLVLYELGFLYDIIAARVMRALPHVLARLRRPPFAVTELEAQLTASNDGEFFRPHTDSGEGTVQDRELTFVYFCHREPQAFSGGELTIYNSDPTTPADGPAASRILLRPMQNSIVFFRSDLFHEIATVHCPSGAFVDSRFTLNGWLHR